VGPFKEGSHILEMDILLVFRLHDLLNRSYCGIDLRPAILRVITE